MAFRSPEDFALSRRTLMQGSAWLTAGAAMATTPLATPAFAKAGSTSWPGVRKAVSDYVSQGKVANMVAAMGWRQGELEIIGAGTLQLDGMTKAGGDSLYRIYSMTKPITGIATMMLIEDGAFKLDTPLADILPAFANMKVQKTYDGGIGADNLEPAKTQITIRHLLTHTAGLGYAGIVQKGAIAKAYERDGLLPGQVSRFPIPGISSAKTIGSLAKFADGLAELPLVLQPGQKWSYSVSLDLLGRVIEVASGKPFDTFLQERLFKPAGMTSTWFKVPQSEVSRLTTNYGILNGMLLPLDPAGASIYLDQPAFPFGGAGLVCSARDYDRFLRMLVGKGTIDGVQVMKPETVRVATSDMLPEGATVSGTWVNGQKFGAGGRVTGTAFGWGGAAGTAAFADMKTGLRAALYTQYMPSEAYTIQQDFPKLVLADLAARKNSK